MQNDNGDINHEVGRHSSNYVTRIITECKNLEYLVTYRDLVLSGASGTMNDNNLQGQLLALSKSAAKLQKAYARDAAATELYNFHSVSKTMCHAAVCEEEAH